MRNAFAGELTKIASFDERVVLLSGDIGNKLFDSFKGLFPQRFLNCGVAEANMIGMASGMGLCGLKPIAYTINSFIVYRCFEQIRVDVCYNESPVVLVGVGGGLSYASLGPTHHSCEDLAVLRVLPSLQIICPGDPIEVKHALRAALKSNKPTYLRLGKKGEPTIHKTENFDFQIGKSITLEQGNDIALLSTGNILPLTIEVANSLKLKGLSVQIESFHTIKPLDEAKLQEVFSSCKLVITIEEHSLLGGFGSAVSEWLTDQPPQKTKLLRFGTSDKFIHTSGEQEYARSIYGLNQETLVKRILRSLEVS